MKFFYASPRLLIPSLQQSRIAADEPSCQHDLAVVIFLNEFLFCQLTNQKNTVEIHGPCQVE